MLFVLTGLNLSSCGEPASPDNDTPDTLGSEAPFPVKIEEVSVKIPGIEDTTVIAYLSDLHILCVNDEVADENKEDVSFRQSVFSNQGIASADQWPDYVDLLNSAGADFLILCGDMTDFASRANYSALKKGLDRLEIPFLYVRADHDTEPYYLKDQEREQYLELQKDLCAFDDVIVKEFPDFSIIGWNNSTDQLTPEGLDTVKKTLEKGKPAILATHVPVEPLQDKSLQAASRAIFSDRSLLWGFGSNEYTPNECTSGLLDLIYEKNSPFTEIVAGHLHYPWDGYVTQKVHEHVFGPAFGGYIGIITVSGTD